MNSISSVLATEKAYNIAYICSKYELGNGADYSSPSSKEKFIKGLLSEKDEKFILTLAKQIIEDYKSDNVALALNNHLDGKYFKLSIITRNELLVDIYSMKNINGRLSTEEFLKACDLHTFIPFDENIIFNFLTNGPNYQQKKEKDLIEALKEIRIQEKLDERFFRFLEQIVHPYTRPNNEAILYLNIINKHLKKDTLSLVPSGEISNQQYYTVAATAGIEEPVKNLIFASNKYKPEIILEDAISNRIKIVKNSEYSLVYDRSIKVSGLLWVDLVEWWSDLQGKERSQELAYGLRDRLCSSLASEPEKILFNTYYQVLTKQLGRKLPALIPQVYLHYDPYSIKTYGIQHLLRQRMDFLLLLSNTKRIVIEVDGKQHYAEGNTAIPKKYAEMVSLDRELKLLGYEVYRFGGYELTSGKTAVVIDFFQKLFLRHGIVP